MNRTTSRELANRIQAIKEGLKINDEKILKMMEETKKIDDMAIEDILRKEGEIIAQDNFIYDLENVFLSSQDLKTIREFKDVPSEEWTFLKKSEKALINNTIKILKKTSLEYRLSRAELMILRKEVIDFVQTRLKTIKSELTPREIINIIVNDYTYIDSLKNLGLYKDEDGYLNKYFLGDDLVYKKNINK
jgi:hypothetical protein